MKPSAEAAPAKDLGPVRKTVGRLDNMLNLLEESMGYERLLAIVDTAMTEKYGPRDGNVAAPILTGLVANYRELRRHILSLRSFEDYDLRRFGPIERTRPAPPELQRTDIIEGVFPALLAQWRLTSSRVYSPSEDLELILVGTKLSDLTWADVSKHMPFDSFGISLPVPIHIRDSQVPNDFLLVNSAPGDQRADRYVSISVFPESLGAVKRTPLHVLDKAEREAKAGTVSPATIKLLETMASRSDRGRFSIAKLFVHEDEKIMDTLQAAREEGFEQPIKVFVGLCLNLAAMRKNRDRLVSSWTPSGAQRARTIDERAITDEAEICSIASEYTLTPELRKLIRQKYILRREGVEMPSGFVEAYYRRKRGTGQDPSAPRVEHVHSYSKGFDRLAEGTLPGGSSGSVKTKRRSKD